MYNLTQVNRDFFIRHYPALKGKGKNSLISSQILYKILGREKAELLITKAYKKGADLYSRTLHYKDIKIEFYSR